MKHIFISHASADVKIAYKLSEYLRNAGHETKVDTRELKLGDDAIAFMNESIMNAHTIIILYSQHTQRADWQKLEINSAIWNEVAQDGGVCIVVRLDDEKIPPILGPKVYGKLDISNPASYQKLIEEICKVILSDKTTSSTLSEAFGSDTHNPFRRIRAEYFEDRPDLLAKTFAPPDALKTGPMEEMMPCFLEGSRGTGKSMLLLSLRGRNFISRHAGESNQYKVFGFYLKLTRGAICNAGIQLNPNNEPQGISDIKMVQLADIASQEIIVCLIESLLSEISFCINNKSLPCDRLNETVLSESIYSILFGQTNKLSSSIEYLLEALADVHRNIANFIRRRFIYEEQCTVPIATFDLNALKRVIDLVKKSIPVLSNSMYVALLDEYENLFCYQQRIVNGLVKLGSPHISVKIAKKLGINDTSTTTTGQELQETHDYTRLVLVYDVQDENQLSAYHNLLHHIVKNIIQSECSRNIDAIQLLPEDNTVEVNPVDVIREVAKLCKVNEEEFKKWPEDKRKEKLTYYGEAAIYRVLYGGKGRHKNKKFCGFHTLAFLSSGVIRYFQEILGVAYHLTYGTTLPKDREISLPPDKQSAAVHLVSQHNLTTLSRNIEQEGEALKYFLLDLGDCLRYKLLKHTSEPEAARLTIEDPEVLNREEMTPLRRLLHIGVREGVLQTKEGRPAFKPKHSSDPQPSEFNICRIYSPVLQISPRWRWRTTVSCNDLLGLTMSDRRANALQKLKKQIVRHKPEIKQNEQKTMF